MLRELHIKNVAVIEEVTVSFEDGFHVLTGETGAGKSILIDSINMALGERTAKDLIRTGADSASVDLVFEPSSVVEEKLLELGIDSEEGLIYISRQISIDGKSRCRINGHMVPLSVLREASEYLLTIHGQNDNQSILSPKSHIHFVDNFGGYQELLEKYQAQYKKVQEIQKELDQLICDEGEKARRIDLLTYQIEELSDANLKINEEEELIERQEYLSNFEKIMENSEKAYYALYGNDNQDTAYDQISEAVRRIENIHTLDEKLDVFYNTLHSVLADLEDVTHELKNYIGGVDFEAGEMEQIGDRLQIISTIKRKYGGSVESALEYLENAKEELSKIEDSDALRDELLNKLNHEKEILAGLAEELSASRTEAAISLQTRIMNELSDLDMQKMRFSVCVEPMLEDDEPRYTKLGCDRVEFLISGNPGEALKPLAKIASGGEMSRIMLAIKSVLADGDIVETLIFDEIDTGVSGRAAQKIAEKICMLSKSHQILCITHLAQIASMADIHFLIEKNSDDDKTSTSVTPLGEEDKKTELARIIGGVMITDLTLQAAQEMIDMAKGIKERR